MTITMMPRRNYDRTSEPTRALVFELATCRFITQREDLLLIGPPGTGKSHLSQALGQAAIQQGHRVLYREAHLLLEELTDATLNGTRKDVIADLSAVPLLIIDDLGMRKLPATAAEDLLEVIMRHSNLDGQSVDLALSGALSLGALARAIPETKARCDWLRSKLEQGEWFVSSLPPILAELADHIAARCKSTGASGSQWTGQ